MNAREFFDLLGVAFVPTAAMLTILWWSARERARKAEETIQRIALSVTEPVHFPEPRSDISGALTSLALEVERLSERQRATAKLLEQSGSAASRNFRVDTPH